MRESSVETLRRLSLLFDHGYNTSRQNWFKLSSTSRVWNLHSTGYLLSSTASHPPFILLRRLILEARRESLLRCRAPNTLILVSRI